MWTNHSFLHIGSSFIVDLHDVFLFYFLQGSRDNMSVVLICFPGAPKVSPEAVKRENELDKYLEARVEGR